MNIWLRLSATFHEHPKMLAVRVAAGRNADSAELGWYRILMAAKRYGRWNFASDAHLEHIAGTFYRFVPLYRDAGLLDHLTVHDGDSYNAIKTDAERKAEQRDREREPSPQRDKVSREGVTTERDMARDQSVTLDNRHRGQTDRTDGENARETMPAEDGREDLEAFLLLTRRTPTPRQRALLDGLLDRHDLTGPKWAADIMLRHPDDPIGAVIEADKAWRAERIAEAQAAEKPKPQPRRSPGIPTHSRELLEHWAAEKRAAQDAEKNGVAVSPKERSA